MSKIIPKKPDLVYNSIEHQAKTAANSLTIGEWNRVVNMLKQQANLNTKYLENLHRLLFYDWNSDDSGYAVVDIFKGIATETYVDEQITERQAIVKVNQEPLTEVDLVYFMQTLEDGMYRIKTDLWGHEFLFVSDMNLPVDPDVEEPVLELKKEYARYTSNGTSYRYDFELNGWVLSAGGGVNIQTSDNQPINQIEGDFWYDTSNARPQTYTITWKRYDGTSIYTSGVAGSTVYAPTGTPDDSGWVYYWTQNSVVVTEPQTIQEIRIPRLSLPQGSLTDKFDYTDGANDVGGVMVIALYNSNNEGVTLRGRILFGGSDFTNEFSHFPDTGDYFFGDSFPPNTGITNGLSVITRSLWTYDWQYPVTIEVWFEPNHGSTKGASNKLIITVNS